MTVSLPESKGLRNVFMMKAYEDRLVTLMKRC